MMTLVRISLLGIWLPFLLWIAFSANAIVALPFRNSVTLLDAKYSWLRTTRYDKTPNQPYFSLSKNPRGRRRQQQQQQKRRTLRQERDGPVAHFLFRSANPSASPSLSVSPTNVPTSSPSNQPSTLPSFRPSESPSESPSVSLVPSVSPSLQPSVSVSPSALPSSTPSDRPSSPPSLSPSFQPTSSPSVSLKPSLSPSNSPSGEPSRSPSSLPTSIPTNAPSLDPTADVRQYYSIQNISLPVIYFRAMDEITIQVFEGLTKLFISQSFLNVEGVTTDVTGVDLVSQEFVVSTRRTSTTTNTTDVEDKGQNVGVSEGLHVQMNVSSDVFPGDPDNYSIDDVIGYGFQQNYTDFLQMLSESSNFFKGNLEPSAFAKDESDKPRDDGTTQKEGLGFKWSTQYSFIAMAVALVSMAAGISIVVFYKKKNDKGPKRTHQFVYDREVVSSGNRSRKYSRGSMHISSKNSILADASTVKVRNF